MINPEILENCTMEENNVSSLSITDDIKQRIKEHYTELETRYGSTIAKIIMGSALLGCLSPIPGSSFIVALPFVGLGELVLWLKQNPQAHEEIKKVHDEKIKNVIRNILKN